jgi:hypothetical protein
LHPFASRLQEQLTNVRVIGPLSGLDATLRARSVRSSRNNA